VRFSNTEHRKHAIPIAIVCKTLLVLPSCIPNLLKADPGPPLPEDFNGATSSENSSQDRIDEFFNDPTLISLFYQALFGNQELKILNENVQIASNEVLARRGAYLPFVIAGGGPSVAKPSCTETIHPGASDAQDAAHDGERCRRESPCCDRVGPYLGPKCPEDDDGTCHARHLLLSGLTRILGREHWPEHLRNLWGSVDTSVRALIDSKRNGTSGSKGTALRGTRTMICQREMTHIGS
jgi:hypothetical protein